MLVPEQNKQGLQTLPTECTLCPDVRVEAEGGNTTEADDNVLTKTGSTRKVDESVSLQLCDFYQYFYCSETLLFRRYFQNKLELCFPF